MLFEFKDEKTDSFVFEMEIHNLAIHSLLFQKSGSMILKPLPLMAHGVTQPDEFLLQPYKELYYAKKVFPHALFYYRKTYALICN